MNDNMIDTSAVEVPTTDANTVPVEGDTPTDADTGEGSDERGNPSREAAKYRRQLRDAEAQRDQLGERLAAMQRSQAEALAREHLADGADMWRDGLELSAVLDDDGNLDPAKVTEAARAARKAHPHWATPRPQKRNPAMKGRLVSGATGRGIHDGPTSSWQKVLNNRLSDD